MAKTDIGQYMGATITQATIGGAASVAGGGKFANGAVTGGVPVSGDDELGERPKREFGGGSVA